MEILDRHSIKSKYSIILFFVFLLSGYSGCNGDGKTNVNKKKYIPIGGDVKSVLPLKVTGTKAENAVELDWIPVSCIEEAQVLVAKNREHLKTFINPTISGYIAPVEMKVKKGQYIYLMSLELADLYWSGKLKINDKKLRLGIFLRKGTVRELIGHILMQGYDDYKTGSADLAYWIDKDQQGKGIIINAVATVIDFGFNKLGLKYININVERANKRSIAIPKGLGFMKMDPTKIKFKLGKYPYDEKIYHKSDYYVMEAKNWKGKAKVVRPKR